VLAARRGRTTGLWLSGVTAPEIDGGGGASPHSPPTFATHCARRSRVESHRDGAIAFEQHVREDPAAAALAAGPITFGKYRLDLAAQQLWHSRQPVTLRRKSWLVLVHLAQRPGVLVSTDELLDAVWPATAVTPNTLTNVIGELRRALGDRDLPPRIIETVHRRGYRFIARIGLGDAPTAASAPALEAAPPRAGFIGRTAELERLRALWQQAQRGRRQVVFVTGEPGIGKTTLVDRFLADLGDPPAAPPGFTVARAQCIDLHGVGESYMPLLEIVEGLASSSAGDAVAAVLRQRAPTWLAQLPSLLPAAEMQALRSSMLGSGSPRMLREGVALFETLAATQPLLVVVEDLHWSDPATVDLIAALAQRTAAARLMLVLTYRSVDALVHDRRIVAVARQLRVHKRALQLAMAPFTGAEVQALLEQRIAGGEIGAGLAEAIERQSGGNPLFVSALLAHLLARQRVQQRDGWVLADADWRALDVPDDLAGMIAAQLSTLTAPMLALLEAASVEGDEFSARGVAAGVDQSLEAVEDLLQEIVQRQQPIVAAETRPWPDGSSAPRYRFTHALYRRAVYDRIAPSRRRRLHRRIGECLEAVYGERVAEIAAPLALHFEAADDVTRRVRYRGLEAANASARFAHADAVSHLGEALAQLRRLPATPERWHREAELELTLGNTVAFASGSADPAVQQAFARAERLASDAQAHRERFRALLGLGSTHMAAGSVFALEPVVREQLEMAATVTPGLAAQAYWRAGELHLAAGELTTARRYLEDCLRAEGEAGIPVVLDVRGIAGVELSVVLALLGELDASRRARDAALRRIESTAIRFSHCNGLWQAALAASVQRDEAGVRQLAERCAAVAEQCGFASFLALRLWADAPARQPRAAARMLEQALAGNAPTAGRWSDTLQVARIAQAFIEAGAGATAETWIGRGLDDVQQLGQRWYEAELWRLRGEALLIKRPRARGAASEPARREAESCFRGAIEIAGGQAARLLVLRATISLARLLRRDGRGDEAAARLAAAAEPFGAEDSAADVRDARRLLQQLD
jgi:DNA-binding winged helix-turn-helix (wHTH) protein/tetratricopeptide (TPR) repeat protein